VIGDDGRLSWIIDAYSHTGNLPYSKPVQGGTNYIRNPLKVVVDAYDGTVSFYVVDRADILTKTYAAIFPTLFKPTHRDAAGPRRNIRYPGRSSKSGARMFDLPHDRSSVFCNKRRTSGRSCHREKTMDSYYPASRSSLASREEVHPVAVPRRRSGTILLLDGRAMQRELQQEWSTTFPDRQSSDRQIDARIDEDAYISQQLTLLGPARPDVIREPLIIPIEDPRLCAAALPGGHESEVSAELRRVIVAYETTWSWKRPEAAIHVCSRIAAKDVGDRGGGVRDHATAQDLAPGPWISCARRGRRSERGLDRVREIQRA
jgi:uncharacterized membrane protein (UPF0182 family)